MGLRDTVDPLAGAYYIEWLTNEMEKKIVECMERVETMGGMVKAVQRGHIQREVSLQAYSREKKIQSGEIIKIGVNKYVMEEEKADIALHPFNAYAAREKKKKLEEIKVRRDGEGVKKALAELEMAARTESNVMPHLLNAVKSYATLGEITKVFKRVFGEFQEPKGL
jgi:methylmalonyl-CoA mutase N-terminal domain/subunit